MKHDITNIPKYEVHTNIRGEEWVKVDNLVFKLRRDSEDITLIIMDEKEKCSYSLVITKIQISDMDQLKWTVNKYVQITEEQLLVLFDCLVHYRMFGTMFKKTNKSYKTTKRGNNYVETDQYLITVSRHGRVIVVKAVSERNEYIIVIDEHDIHDNTKMMNHLDTLKLTVSEFGAVLELIDDIYYDDFGYNPNLNGGE